MKTNRKLPLIALIAALCVCAYSLAQSKDDKGDDKKAPDTQPSLIDVSDKAALEAAMDKDAEVEGVVKSAEWSSSGKVMVIRFEKTDESKFTAAIFDSKKDAMDKAFSGDVAKAMTGAHVRIRGTLKDFKGHAEIVVNMPSQITIVDAGK